MGGDFPSATLDGQPVGSGVPGPIYQRLHQAYQQAKASQTV